MSADAEFHRRHSSHDVGALQERWSALGLTETVIGDDEGFPVIGYAENLETTSPNIYLSAGVHGDEPASVWGLLHWAEKHLTTLIERGIGFTIFPCLNPFGLKENTRRDSDGVDLNRNFDSNHRLIQSWQGFLGDTTFAVALNLHEDYDACGLYLYEIDRSGARLGNRVLNACEPIIARDPRDEIDDSPFENGILNRNIDETEIRQIATEELDGWPEAIYLFLHHTTCALTFESPSEFALTDRIRAHERFVEFVVQEKVTNP